MNKLKVIATTAALALVGVGCSSPTTPRSVASAAPTESAPANQPQRTAAPGEVFIAMFKYSPDPVIVKSGEAVKWTNFDEIQHTVTAGTPDSPTGQFDHVFTDQSGGTFSFTFDKPGDYPYFCARHPNVMAGVVKVS